MTVYVLQCQQTRNIKIGYTARLVQDRLKELSTAASTPLALVKWYPGLTQSHEQQLHATLGQYRVTGEWFRHDALHLVDDAAESLFATGERDFTATCQGKSVSVQTASISIAVLKLNGQNLKKSIIDQMPKAKFRNVFYFDSGIDDCTVFDWGGNPWGWIRLKEEEIIITEIGGELFTYRFNYPGRHETYMAAHYLCEAGFIEDWTWHNSRCFPSVNGKARSFTANEQERFNSYRALIQSLPQLFVS